MILCTPSLCVQIRRGPAYPGERTDHAFSPSSSPFDFTEVVPVAHTHEGESFTTLFYKLADGRGECAVRNTKR